MKFYRNIYKKLVLFFSLSLLFHSLPAQKYAYIQFHPTTGTPFEKVNTVVQDDAGFLWIGSEKGLYRFDGNEFENFGIHLKSQNIHRLLTREEKMLFVNDTGLHQMEDLNHQPKLVEVIQGGIYQVDSLPFYPNDFAIDEDRTIWVSQSDHSIGKYANGIYQTYPLSKTNQPQHIDLHIDENSLVWALSSIDGLLQFDRLNNRFEKVRGVNGGNTFLVDGEYMLLGSNSLQIYFIRNKSKPILLKTIPLPEGEVSAMHKSTMGSYVIGTTEGNLFLLSSIKDGLKPIYGSSNPHRVQDLDFGEIRQIYTTQDSISPQGMLWVSTSNGLWLLKHRYFETVQNLPKNIPTSIAVGNQKTWVSVNGLHEIKARNQLFQSQKIGGNILASALAIEAPNTLWLSTNAPKVELIKIVNNSYKKRYNFSNRGDDIFYTYSDSKKNLWFCQAPLDQPIVGVAKIDASGQVHYYQEDKGFSSRILVIKESNRGEIYAAGIGENSYLYQYDATTDQFNNLSQPLPFSSAVNFEVHDLAIDPIGIVWLATTDGLLRYDSEKISWIKEEKLGHEEIRGVSTLPNGDIWVATATNGLVYYNNQYSIQIGEAGGLPSIINAYRSLATDQNGRVWAGTAEGLVYSLKPTAILARSNTPKLKKIIINGETRDIKDKTTIKIKDYDELSIAYTSLDYHVINSSYQYRLLDRTEKSLLSDNQNWINHGNKAVLNFNDLAVGKYFLEIRAKQEGGYRWSTPKEIQLVITSPWFRQKWFLYFIGFLLFSIIAYYLRFFILYRVQKLQQLLKFQHQKLAEKEAQLNQKIQEFDEHQQEYKTTMSNIQMLELFIKTMPPRAGWNEIITAMGKAVDQSIDIAAFEIAFVEKKELIHRGYSAKEKEKYTYRNKPFDPKISLTAWAIANQQEVVINNFDQEHNLYIERKKAYRYQSIVIIPFLKKKQSVALCAYSIGKQQFNDKEVIMLRILVKFILRSHNSG